MPQTEKRLFPLTKKQLIEKNFSQYRNKVIEVAAFLDRLDRAKNDVHNDFRLQALSKSIEILNTRNSNRVKKILMALSDPNLEPLKSLDIKSAYGAYKPKNNKKNK